MRLAETLTEQGHTLGQLQSLSEKRLIALGLREEQAKRVRGGSRFAIPAAILANLLHESRSTCCVCRNTAAPIIVHHIEEWHRTRDHSENNLVVLCLHCHDKAHSIHQLSRNLTPDILKQLKTAWTKDVKTFDNAVLLGFSHPTTAYWECINNTRLFELTTHLGIDRRSVGNNFAKLHQSGVLDETGLFEPLQQWLPTYPSMHYIYETDGGVAMKTFDYVVSLLDEVLRRVPVFDMSNRWSPEEIGRLIQPGYFIALERGFYLKVDKTVVGPLNTPNYGPWQSVGAHYEANGARIQFRFNRFEATCNSAWIYLSNRARVTAFLRIRDIEVTKLSTIVECSCLALGGRINPIRLLRGEDRPLPNYRKKSEGVG